MKIIQSLILFGILHLKPVVGSYNIRGSSSFYERMLAPDNGIMCSDNPVCVAEGRSQGSCCPNENNQHLDCCNRECSIHTNCAGLGGFCCPTTDNVELDCCDHQPALTALLMPNASPSESPSESPSGTPSSGPSTYPSQSPSLSSSNPTTSSPPTSSSDSPSSAPTIQPICPSSSFSYASEIKSLTTDGGTIQFDLQNLPLAMGTAQRNTVYVQVFVRGDFGQVYEFAELQGENATFIGTVNPDQECGLSYTSANFAIELTTFNSWIANDGIVTFTLDAASAVGVFCRNNDAFIVLCYETSVAGPSVAPSNMPSMAPSNAPSSEPSSGPSARPSTSPSQVPTIPEDDRDGGDGGGPVIIVGPACQDNPGCAALGLVGVCCPTPSGLTLDCCGITIVDRDGSDNAKVACSANPRCNGLAGNCCPTQSGLTLDCCD